MKFNLRDFKVLGIESKHETYEFSADRIQIDIIDGKYNIYLITYTDVNLTP